MKKTITTLALTTLVATSVTFAQDGGQPGQGGPGMPPPGGPRGEFRKEVREERKEIRQEFREDRKEAVGEFKEGMKERRMWNAANASGTATGTRPTPFKDLREDMKEVRKEVREGMKDIRGMMPPRMATMTATQTAAIAGKLGITVEALNAQLASGTKLKEIIKDKIKPEDMKNILPPRVASMTRAVQEQGFFNNIRARIFGTRQEVVEQVQNEYGEIEEVTKPLPPQNFFRRLFNW